MITTVGLNEVLNLKREIGDAQADDFIKQVFADPAKKAQLQQWLKGPLDRHHLSLIKEIYPDVQFIQSAAELPTWAEPEFLKTGAVFFAKHSEDMCRPREK